MKRFILSCFFISAVATGHLSGQMTANERLASVGDAPLEPGPPANLSPSVKPASIRAAMQRVAEWQAGRISETPSQDWTFATLYMGLLSASETLHQPLYRDLVLGVAEHYQWKLGPRQSHADDQAIGQVYEVLAMSSGSKQHLQPLRAQFDGLMKLSDDPAKPVWWWCDALFMAPPVWAGLASSTHDRHYLDYMDRQWHRTADLLWSPQDKLFFRDVGYLNKHEQNGRSIFWSRGNGWVMGGLVRVLQQLPANDPRRQFYIDKLRQMASSVAKIQGTDGLWRAGLLDTNAYPNPEVSGSAFFVYAMAWGIHHHVLDDKTYRPVVQRGWAGLVSHIYADGRLGCIQPVGEAPGAYKPSASYVFGTGAFLMAGSEMVTLSETPRHSH